MVPTVVNWTGIISSCRGRRRHYCRSGGRRSLWRRSGGRHRRSPCRSRWRRLEAVKTVSQGGQLLSVRGDDFFWLAWGGPARSGSGTGLPNAGRARRQRSALPLGHRPAAHLISLLADTFLLNRDTRFERPADEDNAADKTEEVRDEVAYREASHLRC